MDWYAKIALIITSLILFSCGQVGYLTGGSEDVIAPKPILEKMNPPNGSTNTQPKQIEIPFDEFIKLNNPGSNISLIPADHFLKPSITGKSLVLKPSSTEWKQNTTYTILLNRAVKDITKGNDSIMTFVFSTGHAIDSLSLQFAVTDAYSNKQLKNIAVGLFANPLNPDSANQKPTYLLATDENGMVKFNYLKKDTFYAYAFEDGNKNGILDRTEKRGSGFHSVVPDTAQAVFMEIRVMPPSTQKLAIETNNFEDPGMWKLGFNRPLQQNEKITILEPSPVNTSWNYEKDSLIIFYDNLSKSGKLSVCIESSQGLDTITKNYFLKPNSTLSQTNNLINGTLNYTDTFALTFNDALDEINNSEITLFIKSANDTIFKKVPLHITQPKANTLFFIHDKVDVDSVKITLAPLCIKSTHFENKDSIQFCYAVQSLKNVGDFTITLDSIPSHGILDLVNEKGLSIRKIPLTPNQLAYSIKQLQPGNYKFRIIVDANHDSVWSTGDIFKEIAAEQVIWFNTSSRIRANWEVNVKLEIKN